MILKQYVWYHPKWNLIMLRWGYKYMWCHEGVGATDRKHERILANMIIKPSSYGWKMIGKL